MGKTKVLYLSNTEVPYRTKFFNLLSQECELTVLYEREISANRDHKWISSEDSNYEKVYLNGIKIGNEQTFSFRILKYAFGKYDKVIVGCLNDLSQMLAIVTMRIARREYYVNVDGKMFDTGSGIKRKLRRYFIRGAKGYFCAGKQMVNYLRGFVGNDKPIYPYLLSSMDEAELKAAFDEKIDKRDDSILVVGQYEDYKGLDLAAQVAKAMPEKHFIFVGMGKKKDAFDDYICSNSINNVETIAFLQKEELQTLYKKCGALVLPSRQECWGLVINEGAAFGIPIVSTWGSGAAEEFLCPNYSDYLAKAGDVNDLYEKLGELMASSQNDRDEYSEYLRSKSRNYYVEDNVNSFVQGLNAV